MKEKTVPEAASTAGSATSHALRSPLRYVAAAGSATAVLSHIAGSASDSGGRTWIIAAFWLAAIVGFAAVAMLIQSDTRTAWRLAATVSAVSISTWVAAEMPSRDAGPGSTADLGLALIATAAALVVLGSAALTLRARTALPVLGSVTMRRWAGSAGVAVLLAGVGATGAFAGPSGVAAAGSMAGMDMSGSSAMTGTAYWNAVGGTNAALAGQNRRYFIRSEEVVWDYAPTGSNGITGEPFDDVANVYVQNGPGRIGSKYLKCVYHGYTDATFAHPITRTGLDAHEGLLGPVIRAEVGDTITVDFRNTCRIPTSMHPHGVSYAKSSEGAPYADGTSGADKTDDSVPTGGQHTFVWNVPDRAGPGPHDGSSVMWMYHSHTDEVGDTYAGLMGPMIVTARGMARPDGSPLDVDREIIDNFEVMNENNSPYLDVNIHRFAQAPLPDPDDEDFQESNLMHSVNGYVFGNQPVPQLRVGQRVRWYIMSMGTEVDQHTPHWHGNVVTVAGMRMDVVSLMPAGMLIADMVPDNVGTWLFHCHVNDHITAGMLTKYQVTQ